MNTTRTTVTSLVLVIIALFFFLFAPVGLLRYIALFVMGMIILPFLYSLIIPRFIGVQRVEEYTRGIKLADIEIILRVRNYSPIPVTYFSFSDVHGELFSDNDTFLLNLGPFERKTVRYTCRGHKRGEYKLGPVNLKGADLLGFFPWHKEVQTAGKVLVYPSIYRSELVNNRGLPAGNLKIANKMYEDITQFRSLREYVPGDDMKRINWKASAKTNKLYTMEFDATLYFPVIIALNFCREDYPLRSREMLMERATEIAASLAFYFARIQQEIGFVATGRHSAGVDGAAGGQRQGDESTYSVVQVKAGYEHAQEILELLSCLSPAVGTVDYTEMLFRAGLKVPMAARVMVVTPMVREKQAEALIAAKRKGLNLEVFQVESITDSRENDTIRGALKVISIKETGKELVDG